MYPFKLDLKGYSRRQDLRLLHYKFYTQLAGVYRESRGLGEFSIVATEIEYYYIMGIRIYSSRSCDPYTLRQRVGKISNRLIRPAYPRVLPAARSLIYTYFGLFYFLPFSKKRAKAALLKIDPYPNRANAAVVLHLFEN